LTYHAASMFYMQSIWGGFWKARLRVLARKIYQDLRLI
jgi:hypothetical protein